MAREEEYGDEDEYENTSEYEDESDDDESEKENTEGQSQVSEGQEYEEQNPEQRSQQVRQFLEQRDEDERLRLKEEELKRQNKVSDMRAWAREDSETPETRRREAEEEMRRREVVEREEEIKRRQEERKQVKSAQVNLEVQRLEKRVPQRKTYFAKVKGTYTDHGPGVIGLIGTQVGSSLGFTRLGKVGGQIQKAKLDQEKARLREKERNIREMKLLSRKIPKTNNPVDAHNFDHLMAKIKQYDQETQPLRTKVDRLKAERAFDTSIRYTKSPPGRVVRKGRTQSVQSNYGQQAIKRGRGRPPKGSVPKSIRLPSEDFAERSMRGYNKIQNFIGDGNIRHNNKMQNQAQGQINREIPNQRIMSDDHEVKNTSRRVVSNGKKKTNPYGVEDWIMGI